ncbi:AbrB family transcriptional regulator [Acidiphilium acidophilum]|uniref:AbrB family transcriptional regulator n=1 Tax=Acidiphilium acidophilum TaxID=76588 RepID=UPI002E8E77DD|nr:AbrB family transcriptional regulator [Acidiphilium acidophilum]
MIHLPPIPAPPLLRRWLVLIVITLLATIGLAALHIPSAALFAGLFIATILALRGFAPDGVNPRLVIAAQSVLGTMIGMLVQASTLRALGGHIVAVLIVTTATLLVSIAAGLLLSLRRDVDPITGALALTTGGASAIVSLAAQFGGDDRMVAIVQYLRVGLVTASMPLIVALAFHPPHHHAAAAHPATAPWFIGLAILILSGTLGLLLARVTRLPAGTLLGPMIIAGAITLSGIAPGAIVPLPLIDLAYALIGWQAGLKFTLSRLKQVGRALPAALTLIILVNFICAGLGVLLAHLTGVSAYDGYLATVPGGIYAALALAISSRTDVTFVLAVHVLRVVMLMFAMPLFVRLLRRFTAPGMANDV